MRVERLDHIVLTVRDIDATVAFYESALGMCGITFGSGRRALLFGNQKINLHSTQAPIEPHAAQPVPGSADLCFIISTPVQQAIARLRAIGIAVEAGPVPRTGALGPITSAYFRDPDGNLIEVSNYAN
jgi:catechol 2,3-dioxygenase-like lactoylglutathione lyase family enzyme